MHGMTTLAFAATLTSTSRTRRAHLCVVNDIVAEAHETLARWVRASAPSYVGTKE
jgi:hypothetical protein